jgi:hypothetical protein
MKIMGSTAVYQRQRYVSTIAGIHTSYGETYTIMRHSANPEGGTGRINAAIWKAVIGRPKPFIVKKIHPLGAWYPPEESLAVPSVTVSSDSGYVTFKIVNQNIVVTRFLLSNPSTFDDEEISSTAAYHEYVSAGFDSGGRLVVGGLSSGNAITLFYRSLGGSWTSKTLAGWSALGAPSLWSGTNEVRMTFEGESATDYGLVFVRCYWDPFGSPPAYAYSSPEVVTMNIDEPEYPEGYSFLASANVAMWRYQHDIWYSKRWGTNDWTPPKNISNKATEFPDYPQGAVYQWGAYEELSAVWTQKIGYDYFVIYNKVVLPNNPTCAGGSDGIQAESEQRVSSFDLKAVYPNPTADNAINVSYVAPDRRFVSIKLYDVTGRLVENLYQGIASVGLNEVSFDCRNISAGIYFVQLETAEDSYSTKVVINR